MAAIEDTEGDDLVLDYFEINCGTAFKSSCPDARGKFVVLCSYIRCDA